MKFFFVTLISFVLLFILHIEANQLEQQRWKRAANNQEQADDEMYRHLMRTLIERPKSMQRHNNNVKFSRNLVFWA